MADSEILLDMQYKATMKQLDVIGKNQFPFAYAKTLWEVGKTAAAAVQRETRSRFKLHGDFIPRGIIVQPGSTSRVKTAIVKHGLAMVSVMSSRLITPFMAIQEKGGTKKPKPRAKTIPLATPDYVAHGIYTGTGAIKRSNKPRTLLKYYNAHKGTGSIAKPGAKPRPFLLRGSVMVRIAPGSRARTVLYQLLRTARIKPRWGFEPTVRTTVEATWRPTFEFNFKHAMTTAK